jgi:hypothetical protein
MKLLSSRNLKVLWVSVVIVAILFVVYRTGFGVVGRALLSPTAGLVFVLILAAKCLYALLVRDALQRAQCHISIRASYYAYAAADIAKYIPGGIWSIAGRAILYRKLGLGAPAIAKILVLEQFWLISGAVGTGAVLFVLGSTSAPHGAISFGLAALLLLAWIGLLLAADWVCARPLEVRGTLSQCLVQLVAWVLCGLSFALVLPGTMIASERVVQAAAFDFSFAAGLASFFAPAGIGVRDGGVSWLLSGELGFETVLSYAAAHRVIWLLADVFFFGSAYFACRKSWGAMRLCADP